MTRYPSPFIGGSATPDPDLSGSRDFARPFHPETTPEPGEGPEAATVEAPTAAPAHEADVPEYLLGPDAEQEDGLPADVVERLADTAYDLLAGPHGDLIRALIADLSSLSEEIAVPRAFAAGYLASKDERTS